jgi:hypothetical protein
MRSLILTVVLTVTALTVLQSRLAVSARASSNLDLIEAEQQQRLVQTKAEELRNPAMPSMAPAPEWK